MTQALAIRDEQHYLDTVREVRTLAERCDTVDDAKSLADKATAAKVYAQRAKLGGDMVNRAAAAKLWAERRAGELLAAMPKNRGAQGIGTSALPHSQDTPPTLKDVGVTEKQSSQWQRLAAIPADDFEAAVEQASVEGTVSTAKVTRLAEGHLGQRVRDEFFPAPVPVFDAFWKACGLLINKARPDWADGEEWDTETRRQVRQWAPLMVERINELLELADDSSLRVVKGGTSGR